MKTIIISLFISLSIFSVKVSAQSTKSIWDRQKISQTTNEHMVSFVENTDRLILGAEYIDRGPHDDAKLFVDGKGIFKELIITQHNWGIWPDYVFSINYDLMPLNELEEFIKKNKHLPGFPAEKEIIDNGLDLSEITRRQQEKIEELFLHIIQLEKRLNSLEMKNDSLTIENTELKNNSK